MRNKANKWRNGAIALQAGSGLSEVLYDGLEFKGRKNGIQKGWMQYHQESRRGVGERKGKSDVPCL